MTAFKFKNSSDIIFIQDPNTNEGYWVFAPGVIPSTPGLTPVLTVSNNAGGLKITNLGTPTAAGDGATKGYVDTAVTGLLDLRGGYDPTATSGYPTTGGSGTAGVLLKGDAWYILVDGIVGGVTVKKNDVIFAKIDAPAQTDANWEVLQGMFEVEVVAANLAQTVATNDFTFTDARWTTWIAGRVYKLRFPSIVANVGTVTVENTSGGGVIAIKNLDEATDISLAAIVGERWYELQYTGSVLVPLGLIKTENTPLNNLNAAAAPTITDDVAAGYQSGPNASLWFYDFHGFKKLWVCTDATVGAAVWSLITLLNQLNATTNPTAIDDVNAGYSSGQNASIWYNMANRKMFICTDNTTGAAVWQPLYTLSEFVYFKKATVSLLVTNVGHEVTIVESPDGLYDNFYVTGIFISPNDITGAGVTPIINVGNEVGVFGNILLAETMTFPSAGTDEVIRPTPVLKKGVSFSGKPIKVRCTTAATGYTTFSVDITLALICLP